MRKRPTHTKQTRAAPLTSPLYTGRIHLYFICMPRKAQALYWRASQRGTKGMNQPVGHADIYIAIKGLYQLCRKDLPQWKSTELRPDQGQSLLHREGKISVHERQASPEGLANRLLAVTRLEGNRRIATLISSFSAALCAKSQTTPPPPRGYPRSCRAGSFRPQARGLP